MKKLWNRIDREPLPTEEEYTLCLRILGAFWALMGFLLWLVLELVCRPGLTWLVILIILAKEIYGKVSRCELLRCTHYY